MKRRIWTSVIGLFGAAGFFFQIYSINHSGSQAQKIFKEYCAQNHLDYQSYKAGGVSANAFVNSWSFYIPPGITPPGFKTAYYRVSVPWIGTSKIEFVPSS